MPLCTFVVGEIVRTLDPAAVDELANARDVRRRDGRLFILGWAAAHYASPQSTTSGSCATSGVCPDNVAELTARTNDEGWETS